MNISYELVELITVLIEIGICYVFVAFFLEDATPKDHIPGIVITLMIAVLFHMITIRIAIYSVCRLCVYMGIAMLSQCLFYRKHYLRIVVMTVTYMLFLALDDYITVVLMSYLTGTELVYFQEMTLYRVFATIIAKILLLVWVFLIQKKSMGMKKLKKHYLFIILGITGVILLFALYIFNYFMQRNYVSGTDIVLFCLLWVVEILSIYSFAAIAESSEKEEKLQLMNLYNGMLQKLLEAEKHSFDLWSGRVHDYKNHIIYMRGLLESEEYEKLNQLLQEEAGILDYQSAYIQSGYQGIDAMINSKMVYAESQGIHMFCNINVPLGLLLDEGAMVTVLGNLLDNAIRAEMSMKDKLIELNICYKKENLYIKIVNHTGDENIDFQTSSKEDSRWHGIGLRSVKHQVKELQGDFRLIQEKNKVIAMVVLYDCGIKSDKKRVYSDKG